MEPLDLNKVTAGTLLAMRGGGTARFIGPIETDVGTFLLAEFRDANGTARASTFRPDGGYWPMDDGAESELDLISVIEEAA